MTISLGKKEIIHFVGIGGIGMSGLALIMKDLGFNVKGSDQQISKNIDRLKRNKINVQIGHKKKNLSNTYEILISFQTGGTPEYLYPKNVYFIRGLAGTATVKGYTCDTNKGPLQSTNSCTVTNIDNCLNSYETDTATSPNTNYRCKLDGQNCVRDEGNIVTKSTSPDIDLYCSTNVPILSANVFKCEEGNGKLDNSPLELTTNCATVTRNCSDYYTTVGNSSTRCKNTKNRDGSFTCQSNPNNIVTITNGNACSAKKVFTDTNELQQSINTLYLGTSTVNDKNALTTMYGNIQNWDISNIDNTSNLFKDKNITDTNFDISSWDTSNIKYADNMFQNAYINSPKFDVSNWNMSGVTNCYNFNSNSSKPLRKGFKYFQIDKITGIIKLGLNDKNNLIGIVNLYSLLKDSNFRT